MKLYLAVLDGLTPGQRIAQATHAVTEMAVEHPEAFRAWRDNGNTVVCVAMSAREMERLLVTATMEGDAVVAFCEPDREGERTAVAVFPSQATQRLLRRATLA